LETELLSTRMEHPLVVGSDFAWLLPKSLLDKLEEKAVIRCFEDEDEKDEDWDEDEKRQLEIYSHLAGHCSLNFTL